MSDKFVNDVNLRKVEKMKKIFIALLVLGFLSSYSFAEEAAVSVAKDTGKAAETKPAKKAKKKMKASKKAKKGVKEEKKDEKTEGTKEVVKQ